MDALYEHSPVLENDAGILKGCSVYALADAIEAAQWRLEDLPATII
jgi:hypothetical protein